MLVRLLNVSAKFLAGRFVSRSSNPGGRGRIRTFVARKERQIYSLLVLATHPPVRENLSTPTPSHRAALKIVCGSNNKRKTQNGLVSKDTSPFMLSCRDSLRPHSAASIWWSWRRELNPRPSDYKSDALPAELRQRRSNRTRITDWALRLQELDSKLLGGKPQATVEKCPLSVHP